MNRRPFLIALVVLSLFAACQKDSDSPPPVPPVTEPLAIAAAKPGDTLFIKGENFSAELAKNSVKINGVEATVVVASTTELKVLVPANATTGPVTVTVNGQTTEVGTLIVNQFALYTVKNNYQGQTSIHQLITIDPSTGNEAVVVPLDEIEDGLMYDMVYLPATNELVGINGDYGLLRINITTKQKTSVDLDLTEYMGIEDLVVDKYSNLYAVKYDWTDQDHYNVALIKIDPKTGNYTAVKSFEYKYYWESLVYLSATDEIVGLGSDDKALFKLNLATKDTSSVILQGAPDIEYRELVIDNQSNVYAYKGKYSDPDNPIGQIVKLNAASGQETLIKSISDQGKMHDAPIYVPQRNELIGVWEQTGLYKLNLGTKTGSMLPLTNEQNITYNEITGN